MPNVGSGSHSQSYISTLNAENLLFLIDSNKLYGYREFCRILQIPVLSSGSNGQTKQLKELSMICEYEKENRKYRFIRLRDQDEIMLFNERAIYSPLIEYIISEKFCSDVCDEYKNDGILFISMSQLLVFTGMVNQNFNQVRTGFDAHETRIAVHFANKGKFDIGDLKMFVNVSYRDILKPIMRDALKSMDNKRSITIQKGFKLYTLSDSNRAAYYPVLATSQLGQQLLRICADAMTQLNINKVQELYTSKKYLAQDYFNLCNEMCFNQLGYNGFYDCYAIIVDKVRTRHNMDILQYELNQRIQDRLRNAKQFGNLSINSRDNLLDAVIDLNTNYDFKLDLQKYRELKEEV